MVRKEGFSLVEVVMAVLIAGLLAAIATPLFSGQRTKSKNAAAMTAVRSAMDAATAYYSQNESYAGLTTAKLSSTESTLSATAASGTATPGPAANPAQIYVAGPGGGAPTASEVTLCSAGQGDAVYCARSENGEWKLGKGEQATIAAAADYSGFREGSWGTATDGFEIPFYDGFNVTSLRSAYTIGGTVVASGGQVTLTCDAAYSEFYTPGVTEWDGRSVEIQNITMPGGAGNAETYVGIGKSSDLQWYWNYFGGALYATLYNGTWVQVGASLPYNSSAMKYIRVRYDEGQSKLFYEYSADRATWVTHTSLSVDPADISGASPEVGCGKWGGAVRTAVFDNFRVY